MLLSSFKNLTDDDFYEASVLATKIEASTSLPDGEGKLEEKHKETDLLIQLKELIGLSKVKFEQAVANQANRLASQSEFSNEDLMQLTLKDVAGNS